MRHTTNPSVSIVLTTVSSDDDARAIATALVNERLAACVNILPTVTSIYRWKEKVGEDVEQQLVIKTSTGRLPQLETRLRELHSYETPEFLPIHSSGGSDAYLEWVLNSTY